MKTTVTFKNVEEEVLKEFKMESIKEGRNLGALLTQVLMEWIEKRHQHTKKKKLLDFKPVNFGPGTEKLSEEVDKIVYG